MPQYISFQDLENLSREDPCWEPGCTLRLEHPTFGAIRTALGDVGSLHTLVNVFFEDGYWLAHIEGCSGGYYTGRFSLASAAKTRYKTNHKIGVPKGKLP